ncbi:UvrD-helicase domain-containing protein [Priestia megaterium]|uniref:UvrD-helicase domain-containing protein n=1 Tax=Priestia megaterium TaxID=1404 RepID=UPI002795AC1F|nr:UvrD-helicase domain-containing protein [Priestia megaterium]
MLIDQRQRDEILADNESIVVSASAGSGKTTIMVRKMAIELEKITNHQTIAAITFTVKATEEIKRKVSNKIAKPFVTMTNDAFIENEIIRPFIKDAYGVDYGKDYIVNYERQYKFEDFSTGLEQLKIENILGSFEDNTQNFNFRLAFNILERSTAAQEYIKFKFTMIFIDEYQDSDGDMHRFFMKLKNDLNIKLFIVGDSKQAIYIWRGAMRNIFELLENENFNFYELVTNFRCHKEIENYANVFHNQHYVTVPNEDVQNVFFKDYYSPYDSSELKEFVGFLENFNNLVEDQIIDINNEITIIANFNKDAMKITDILNQHGYNFVFIPKTPIDEGIPNGHLLKALAFYTKNSTFSIYDFIENVHINERNQTRVDINNIIGILKNREDLNQQIIEDVITQLANYLELSISEEEINKFYDSVCNSQYNAAFQLIEEKHKVMTVYASKGLEFSQVISFSRYYKIYDDENIQNHYVCITRAKDKFVMFIDNQDYYSHVLETANENGITDINKLVKMERAMYS